MSTPHPIVQAFEKSQLRQLTPFRVGDTVKVHYRILEGEKERVQVFQGVVIRKSKGGMGSTFCVRKTSYGVGVERVFPNHSPRIEKIEVVSSGHVRRSRLYFLRELEGKKARLRDASREGARASVAPQANAEASATATPTTLSDAP